MVRVQTEVHNEANVKKMFADLDRRYFGARLHAEGWRVEVRNLTGGGLEWYTTPNGDLHAFERENGIMGIALHTTCTIFLDHHEEQPDELRGTLLHEMVHASIKRADGHGRRFVNELKRLSRAGEKCLQRQIVVYGLPPLLEENGNAARENCKCPK